LEKANKTIKTVEILSFLEITPIEKLYIFRLVKGMSNYSKLLEYFSNNPEEAFQLGFYKKEDNSLDITPKRTFNHYLLNKITKEYKHELSSIAEYILSFCNKKGILLDICIVEKVIREKKEDHIKICREAIKLIKRLVYPQVDIKIKSNGKFTTKDLLDVLVHVALTRDFAHNGAETFKVDNERISPSGDLMMYHFSKFNSVHQIREMFEKISDFIFNFARKNYNQLGNRKHDIAYDVHKIPYYGKGIQYACGDQFERGTSNFIEFLTCSIVVAGRRFILDVVPIHPLDNMAKLLDRSLRRVRNKISIERAYLDRGFNSAEIFRVLKDNKAVECCYDVNCPSEYTCNRDHQCQAKEIVKLTCPNECCANSEQFIDRPCAEGKSCINNACTYSNQMEKKNNNSVIISVIIGLAIIIGLIIFGLILKNKDKED